MTIATAEPQSMIRFDPSQRRFFEDQARVIVVNWHRQKGKDFTAAAKAVRHCLKTGQDWFIISITQRQADATFAKCRAMARALMAMLKIVGETVEGEYGSEQFDKWIKQAFHFTAREIRFPNGGRVVSLPGRDPDTLAGLTGNVIFTEFGLFPGGGYEHWGVVFPLTTRGFSCIIISTPRGKNTKFYELWLNQGGLYSVHTCDIYQSVEQDGFVLRDNNGQPCSIEQFRKLYGDEGKWPREYECKFTGDLSTLVKWAQLEQAAALSAGLDFNCIRVEGESGWDAAFFSRALAGGGRIEVGWDVARTSNLSVVTANVAIFGRPTHLSRLAIMHNTPFALMREVVRAAMEVGGGSSVGCGDATGMGIESNETLTQIYRERWEGVNFAGGRKKELASGLVTAFGDGTQTIPALDGPYKFVATDLYAIQKDDTGGTLVLEETENPLLDESHCDIGWSLALARRAGAKNIALPLPPALLERPDGL